MALVHTAEGRFRYSIHSGTRFLIQRHGALERSEAYPNGKVVKFVVTDNIDSSVMIIDEEDADQIDALLVQVLAGQADNKVLEDHIAHIFDDLCPPIVRVSQ